MCCWRMRGDGAGKLRKRWQEMRKGSGTDRRRRLLGTLWIVRFIGRLIAVRGVRIAAAFGVVVVAVVGVGAQLRPQVANSAMQTNSVGGQSNGVACAGQSSSTSGAVCYTSNDLLANSITRAVSVATRPTPTPISKSQAQSFADQPPNTVGQPCHDSYMFVPKISAWTTPPGCYATIFTPDRSQYSAPSTFGYCNWWVEALHPRQQDILYGSEYARSTTPVVGAAVWFPPNVQGGSSAGHWAQLVAIGPDHSWLLITEMNFGWRGGGFGKVDYRYVHVDPAAGVVFVH